MNRRRTLVISSCIVLLLCGIAIGVVALSKRKTKDSPNVSASQAAVAPITESAVILKGRQFIWDIAFLPSGELLFTERGGQISAIKHGALQSVGRVADVKATGEGGLMGLTVDPDFVDNRFIYTCHNTVAKDIRVARWKLRDDLTLGDRTDIITGIPANTSGRHSGCRVQFGSDGYLWVGTGDTAQADTAIKPKSLGGKVLRVTRDGAAVPGNMGGEFDPRIYSYGHRNVQGLAFFKQIKHGVQGLSIEHGSTVDDEVNELRAGNFGWAPGPNGYDESVPMTDMKRFPNALPAIWSSGSPTQAPSGGTIIYGERWKSWNGALAVAVLKDEHLKILRLNDHNKVIQEEKILQGTYGRIRAVTQGLDGNLYVATSNGVDDKLLVVWPQPEK